MSYRNDILKSALIRVQAKLKHAMRYPNHPVYKWKRKLYLAKQDRILARLYPSEGK